MRLKFSGLIIGFIKATQLWKNYAFILRELKYFPLTIVLAIVFTLLAAVFEGFGVGFILTLLQSLINPDAEPIRTGVEWFDIWMLGVNASATERLYRISVLILITTALRLSFTYWSRLYLIVSQFKLAFRLRHLLFEQLQAISLSYFTKTRSGNLVNSLTVEINKLTQAFEISSLFITKGSIMVAYAVSMLLLSWQLTIISVMLFSLISIGLSTLIAQVREASFDKTRAYGHYISTSLEFINGIRTVQSFAAQNFERKRFREANRKVLEAETKARSAIALIEPLSEGMASAMLIGMLILSFTILIPQGQLQPAGLLTFLVVLLRLIPIVRQFNGARAKFSNFQGSFANIKALLNKADKPYLKDGDKQFSGLSRSIDFVAVDFGYSPETIVLHDITLTIEKGKMTALVGSSGAGKTTLVDLIPRFYDPTQGQILVDSVDLRSFKIKSLRQRIAIVSQDTFIFNTSIRNNIAYAMEDVDEARILEAAELANALEFIQKMPEGLETQLGDRGVRLSGGQRQRIAIARALLCDPDILILDEATSALDSVSERLIQKSIEKLTVGRTVIAIAHRLSTIMRADKVVVLEQGRIVEQGKYQDLLRQRGRLWKYHQIQHELTS